MKNYFLNIIIISGLLIFVISFFFIIEKERVYIAKSHNIINSEIFNEYSKSKSIEFLSFSKKFVKKYNNLISNFYIINSKKDLLFVSNNKKKDDYKLHEIIDLVIQRLNLQENEWVSEITIESVYFNIFYKNYQQSDLIIIVEFEDTILKNKLKKFSLYYLIIFTISIVVAMGLFEIKNFKTNKMLTFFYQNNLYINLSLSFIIIIGFLLILSKENIFFLIISLIYLILFIMLFLKKNKYRVLIYLPILVFCIPLFIINVIMLFKEIIVPNNSLKLIEMILIGIALIYINTSALYIARSKKLDKFMNEQSN